MEVPKSSSSLGYRIVSAGTEWVAPPDATDCKPTTPQRAVALERFDGIDGAARIITACRRKQVTQCHLIPPYEQYQERPHHVSGDAGGTGVAGNVRSPSIMALCQRMSWTTLRSKSDASSRNDAR